MEILRTDFCPHVSEHGIAAGRDCALSVRWGGWGAATEMVNRPSEENMQSRARFGTMETAGGRYAGQWIR